MAFTIKGLDQVTAWIGGVVIAGAVIGVVLFLGKSADKSQDALKEARAKIAEELLAEATNTSRKDTASVASDSSVEPPPQELPAKHPVSAFSYTGASAPWRWSDLKEEWRLCGTGKRQSPIDLSGAKIDAKLKALKFNYQHGVTNLSFANQTLQGDVEFGSWLDVDGDRYDLKNVSVHTPSEHRVNGLPFEMEIQLQHQELSGRVIIVAVLLTAGKSNPTLLRIAKDLPRYEGETGSLNRFLWTDILPPKRTYWQYDGSWTTPPCTENVTWIVLTDTVQAATREIDSVGALQKNNARPTHELGHRLLRRSDR